MTALWMDLVSVKPRSRTPSRSRGSRPSDVNGTGASSHRVASSAGACEGRGACVLGMLRERPPKDRRPGGRRGRCRSVVFEFKSLWLARAEGDDAPDGIVRRNANGHAISRNNFDAEAAHSAAELRE